MFKQRSPVMHCLEDFQAEFAEMQEQEFPILEDLSVLLEKNGFHTRLLKLIKACLQCGVQSFFIEDGWVCLHISPASKTEIVSLSDPNYKEKFLRYNILQKEKNRE